MPWCPHCKAEYQEGYTDCSDCGIPLVDSLEEESECVDYVPFFQADDKRIADKLARYFEYSELKAKVSYDEENEFYIVSIQPHMEKQAKKLYQAFIFVERENLEKGIFEEKEATDDSSADMSETENEEEDSEQEETADDIAEQEEAADDIAEQEETSDDSTEQEETSDESKTSASIPEDEPDVEYYDEELYVEADQPSDDSDSKIPEVDFDSAPQQEDTGAYIMKADKYKDLAGTVWIFLIFGVAGLVFVLLNMAGILSVLNGWMPNMIMLALFLFFIYVAISTNSKAKKVKSEIEAENKLTQEINAWFEKNFTEEFLASIHNDAISEELNFIKATDTIKEMLLKEFGPLNLAYVDRLIDEYYNSHFE